MDKKIQSALISVFYKDGLEPVVRSLHQQGVTLYSTGGTQKFIEDLGLPVVPVENLTGYPSILGGRVKTLHPSVFGGILGRRSEEQDLKEMKEYRIPEMDVVIVDLYPFEETLAQTGEEKLIIEKIDIGGPSMIRAAAKNFKDVAVLASKDDYAGFVDLFNAQQGSLNITQRRQLAAKAFEIVKQYDIAISDYFNAPVTDQPLRYGENPHQQASIQGDLSRVFTQLHGKELSYNNLVDVDAAIQLAAEFNETCFAVIKHTNVCGMALRETVHQAWTAALAGDPESAFGGVLITNGIMDAQTAEAINEIFFEVLIARGFEPAALAILQTKKNRILLQLQPEVRMPERISKTLVMGTISQNTDQGNVQKFEQVGGREATEAETADLLFANLVCKHLKSNAIAIVKDRALIGKGCGQTSRVDALRQALEKTRQFSHSTEGAAMASDAFFPFNDCVQMAHEAGITAIIQPGGSIRDKDSIEYCQQNNIAMVMTGLRHFRH